MEHRCNPRIAINTRVILYHNRMRAITCKATNIGAGGIFVASKAMVYPRNTMLEVEIHLPVARGTEQFIVQALVVYSSENGMGLVFPDSGTDLYRALNQLEIPDNRVDSAWPQAYQNLSQALG